MAVEGKVAAGEAAGKGVAAAPAPTPEPLFHAVAKWDFKGADEEDLPLTKGDVVAVTQTKPDGWWVGERVATIISGSHCDHSVGVFPGNYMQQVGWC